MHSCISTKYRADTDWSEILRTISDREFYTHRRPFAPQHGTASRHREWREHQPFLHNRPARPRRWRLPNSWEQWMPTHWSKNRHAQLSREVRTELCRLLT